MRQEEPGRRTTFRDALKCGETYLCSCGIADASVDAWLLLEYVTGMTRAVFLAESGQTMEAQDGARYRELLLKRGSHIPLQHLTGEQEFMGLAFYVNEHVLIPRQDTEILVEETMKHLSPGMRVLDLCTGSGCIAVSLAKLFPGSRGADEKALTVEASDLSAEALEVAEKNAGRHGAAINLIRSDLFSELSGRYDVIVSNPPYIRSDVIRELSEEVRCHEPYQALDGRADGLHFYREIIRGCKEHLAKNGWLLFEIGYDQAEAVTELLRNAGFEEVGTVKDLAGLDRVVLGRYPEREREEIHV